MCIEDVQMVKYTKLQSMDIDKYDQTLSKQIDPKQFDSYCEQRTLYFKSKTTAKDFFKAVIQICGKRVVLYMQMAFYSQFIRL